MSLQSAAHARRAAIMSSARRHPLLLHSIVVFGIGWPLIAAGGQWRDTAGASTLGAYVTSVGSRVVSINLWEELTWAGFFQWRLQRRHDLIRAALITAVPFAAMHVAIFCVDGPPTVSSVATLLVFSALFRLLEGTVLGASRGSVLAVAVVHASFNSTNNPEGVLYAAIEGVNLAWEALAAALVLTVAFGTVLRVSRRPCGDHTGCPSRSSSCNAAVSGSGSASRSVRSNTVSRS